MKRIGLFVIAAALLWQALVASRGFRGIQKETHARDYASYHYAEVVAARGGDPYDKNQLSEAARRDGTRAVVHPFFYPPPFLLLLFWSPWFSLTEAWQAWYWVDAAAALSVALALALWWRRLDEVVVPATSFAVLALLTAVVNNHMMGQANFPVLLFVVLGLWLESSGKRVAGGALVGLACMMKMSPALFVAWWMLRGRWRAAISACVAAVVLSVMTVPLLGVSEQVRFYTQVLPGFASGDYNGLTVPMTLFGNHSLPNLWIQLFPAPGNQLSSMARLLSSGGMLLLVGGQAFLWRKEPESPLQLAGQVGAVACTMLLVPVYTYEHHLIWAWPAVVALAAAASQRRLPPTLLVGLGLAVAVWAYELSELKTLSTSLSRSGDQGLGWLVQEAKFASLLLIWLSSMLLGAGLFGRAEN